MRVTKSIWLPITTALICAIAFQYLSADETYTETNLDVVQTVQKYKYPVEVHEVTTEDGYLLTLHRIPHGLKKDNKKRIPVLFIHGMFTSAWNFVNLGPNKSLSFLLAEKGYDVWLGNVRGTFWSRKHKVLDPDTDASFWNFTFYEMGVYDIPAMIDYVLDVTSQESVHYVGFSQGTILFFTMVSERVEYNKKIRLMTALAPAVFLDNPHSVTAYFFTYFWKLEEKLMNIFDIWEVVKKGDIITTYLKHVCNPNSFLMRLCIHHVFAIWGYSYEELDELILSQAMANFSTSVSAIQLMHLFQMMQTGDFRRYDYGEEGNIEKYGQQEPRRYDLSKAEVPVALYYSSNDWLVNAQNVYKLAGTLPNVVKTYQVPSKTFNHQDFISAKNVVELLYNSVIDEILKY